MSASAQWAVYFRFPTTPDVDGFAFEGAFDSEEAAKAHVAARVGGPFSVSPRKRVINSAGCTVDQSMDLIGVGQHHVGYIAGPVVRR